MLILSLLINFERAICLLVLAVPSVTGKCEREVMRGDLCQYKCHCEGGLDACRDDGSCDQECKSDYMGNCQHIVIGRWQAQDLQIEDSSVSCNHTLKKIVVNLEREQAFLWMRVWTKAKAVNDTADSKDNLYIRVDGKFLPCVLHQLLKVSEHLVDIACPYVQDTVSSIEFEGETINNFCLIKVSGGRNYALNQQATQSHTAISRGKAMEANLAVDGSLEEDSCISTQDSTSSAGTWNLELRNPIDVSRIRLIAKLNRLSELSGMMLRVLRGNETIFEHFGDDKELEEYNISPGVLRGATNITLERNGNLIFCELELYGECPRARFSDCESDLKCECSYDWESCSILTGRCPSGCGVGFIGDTCSKGCSNGTYGKQCNKTCSQFCDQVECDTKTGHCLNGCSNSDVLPPLCILAARSIVKKQNNTIIPAVIVITVSMSILLILFMCPKRKLKRFQGEEGSQVFDASAQEKRTSLPPGQTQLELDRLDQQLNSENPYETEQDWAMPNFSHDEEYSHGGGHGGDL